MRKVAEGTEAGDPRGDARTIGRWETGEAAGSVFSPALVVFTLEPRGAPCVELDLRCVPPLAERWREALVSRSNDMPERVREVVSGHDATGAPLAGAHLAFMPLADVGGAGSSGRLWGLAAVLPAELSREEHDDVLRVLGRVRELRLGRLGVWGLARSPRGVPLASEDAASRAHRAAGRRCAEPWTAYPEGATHWATVTPVAFDRHPKAKDAGAYQREAAEMIGAACRAIGLPGAREVIVTPMSPHLGVPPAHAFPRLVRKDGGERRHAHAILVFEKPVRGPVLIGAGRYRGYGVCRAMDVE